MGGLASCWWWWWTMGFCLLNFPRSTRLPVYACGAVTLLTVSFMGQNFLRYKRTRF
ncbi:conserved hypothetical protein [Ricinus communis]|uniref:Uncharacterized protein n=1 Tax=Ricinus communis TaxID=3988 RepID=B9RTU0_RICCO|nr:conserved hypothetical protein [Ricinus communis]